MTIPTTKGEWITNEEQLQRWVRGESVHRQFKMEFVDNDGTVVRTQNMDECTPDFSCCRPQLLAVRAIREAFAAASARERHKFLGTFLQAMLADASLAEQVKVVVADVARERFVTEMIALSGEDSCQACGARWEVHGQTCAGSKGQA
jgi:hypothetical protein